MPERSPSGARVEAFSPAERERLDRFEVAPHAPESAVERVARAIAKAGRIDYELMRSRRAPRYFDLHEQAAAALSAMKPGPGR